MISYEFSKILNYGGRNFLEGSTIAVSDNGKIIIVGTPNYSLDNKSYGAAIIYQDYQESEPIILTHRILDSGEGSNVAITLDGSTLAVYIVNNEGHSGVFIYQKGAHGWFNSSFISTLSGLSEEGKSLIFSADSTSLYVGSPNYKPIGQIACGGLIYYKKINNDVGWQVFNIFSNSTHDFIGSRLGSSLASSKSGEWLAIGCPRYKGNKGATLILKKNDQHWDLDTLILGTLLEAQEGSSLSFSENDELLAISAPLYKNFTGCVMIYERKKISDMNNWATIPVSTINKYLHSKQGVAIQFFADNLLAISEPFYGSLNGGVSIYQNRKNNVWYELTTVSHPSLVSQQGTSFFLTNDGEKLIVGAPFYKEKGGVLIFNQKNITASCPTQELNNVLWSETLEDTESFGTCSVGYKSDDKNSRQCFTGGIWASTSAECYKKLITLSKPVTENQLSGGTIAGIIIAVLIFVVAIAFSIKTFILPIHK